MSYRTKQIKKRRCLRIMVQKKIEIVIKKQNKIEQDKKKLKQETNQKVS